MGGCEDCRRKLLLRMVPAHSKCCINVSCCPGSPPFPKEDTEDTPLDPSMPKNS
jgi:hypothetical protein